MVSLHSSHVSVTPIDNRAEYLYRSKRRRLRSTTSSTAGSNWVAPPTTMISTMRTMSTVSTTIADVLLLRSNTISTVVTARISIAMISWRMSKYSF